MSDIRQQDSPDFKIFSVVFFYCMIIIALPVVAFFGSKVFIFDGILSLTTVASNVWSAVVAVVVLHVALGIFIHKAYSDTEPAKAPVKQD